MHNSAMDELLKVPVTLLQKLFLISLTLFARSSDTHPYSKYCVQKLNKQDWGELIYIKGTVAIGSISG